MMDNGAFQRKGFDEKHWLLWLEKMQPYRQNCIAIVAPDVLTKHEDGSVTGDWSATVEKFKLYAPTIREYGYPVAFVSQDGLLVENTPWGEFDVLFIGGSDRHKLSEAWELITEAKRRGIWIHVGRVNSIQRIDMFWMVDSCDGTTLAFEPSMKNQRRIINAARYATNKKTQPTLWGTT